MLSNACLRVVPLLDKEKKSVVGSSPDRTDHHPAARFCRFSCSRKKETAEGRERGRDARDKRGCRGRTPGLRHGCQGRSFSCQGPSSNPAGSGGIYISTSKRDSGGGESGWGRRWCCRGGSPHAPGVQQALAENQERCGCVGRVPEQTGEWSESFRDKGASASIKKKKKNRVCFRGRRSCRQTRHYLALPGRRGGLSLNHCFVFCFICRLSVLSTPSGDLVDGRLISVTSHALSPQGGVCPEGGLCALAVMDTAPLLNAHHARVVVAKSEQTSKPVASR